MKHLPENILQLQFKGAQEVIESMEILNDILAFHVNEYKKAYYFAKLFKFRKFNKHRIKIATGIDNVWYIKRVYEESLATKETKELCGLLLQYLFDLAKLKDPIIAGLCLDPKTKKFKKSVGLENWKKISGNLKLPGIKRIGET